MVEAFIQPGTHAGKQIALAAHPYRASHRYRSE
jgi:hypothetical protein